MIYTFRCVSCKYEYDEIVSDSSTRVSKCPKCNSKALKVFSAPVIKIRDSWPQFNAQAGKSFSSRKEEDEYFDSIGAERI